MPIMRFYLLLQTISFLLLALLASSGAPVARGQFNATELLRLMTEDLPQESCMSLAQLEEAVQVDRGAEGHLWQIGRMYSTGLSLFTLIICPHLLFRWPLGAHLSTLGTTGSPLSSSPRVTLGWVLDDPCTAFENVMTDPFNPHPMLLSMPPSNITLLH